MFEHCPASVEERKEMTTRGVRVELRRRGLCVAVCKTCTASAFHSGGSGSHTPHRAACPRTKASTPS